METKTYLILETDSLSLSPPLFHVLHGIRRISLLRSRAIFNIFYEHFRFPVFDILLTLFFMFSTLIEDVFSFQISCFIPCQLRDYVIPFLLIQNHGFLFLLDHVTAEQ
jgi:hypothetical protein